MTIRLEDFPEISPEDGRLNGLVEESLDWAHANGLVMRTPETKDSSEVCLHTPLSLLPTPFPKPLFQQAKDVQNLMARLYHAVAYDANFLEEAHREVVATDEFTRGLLNILKSVVKYGLRQKLTIAIQRCDYMCHKDPHSNEYVLKQVEVNNIASSMGGHADRVSALHRRTLKKLGFADDAIAEISPSNGAIDTVASGLLEAWQAFGDPSAIVLFIVENVNQNQIDIRHVEYALQAKNGAIRVEWRTLTQSSTCLKRDEHDHLILDGKERVGIVYFRAGYSPHHYPTEAREEMELSDAIKCPWIGLQLANTKKVQQVLADDGQVERFVGRPRDAAAIRATFAGLWALEKDDPITEKIIKHAITHPAHYVLKPQLEGGGGNFYGDNMANKLQVMTRAERGAHILMERLRPQVHDNYLIRARRTGPLTPTKVVSELGVYGWVLGREDESGDALRLHTGGHLLRTKGETVDEGGVAVGAAVIDSPFLFEPF